MPPGRKKLDMAENTTVVTHTYDLLKYIVPQLLKFPRSQKFVLADKIQNNLTHVLELLIEAYYTGRAEKGGILKRANIELEKLRYLLRLAYDLRCINARRYEYTQLKVDEIGKQVGAWLKSVR